MKNDNDAIVIGAGPAGMMAAITAARLGRKVLVIERNDQPGRKLRITGKGRCNVTNFSSPRDIMANTPGNGKFLFSCLNRFPPEAVMEFFEQIGVPLKVERGNRVFPVSDKAGDVVDALVREMRTLGIKTVKGRVRELLIEDGAVRGVSGDGFSYKAESVLIATGGLSYPKTGSTGDGYRLAKQAGHEVTPRGASLVPLECAGSDCPDMQGLSLRNIAIELKNEAGKSIYKDFGEMLFT
ncbi:MAG: aminoacetone oxidase family FAD-binding enzyme, partial [Oscillospiraceae bacterium]|nr:aminoacetone oxidase family FAD-binding enzyme [Oscillospiraceae bacterium]